MTVLQANPKRLGIYSFYDAQGIVDRYVTFFLRDLQENLSDLIVVVNGLITVDEKQKLLDITPKVIIRENIGYDIWGYKTGLAFFGWDRLAEFDEIIVVNNTIMGPVYPFRDMFAAMDQRDLDFWGMTRHDEFEADFLGIDSKQLIPEHIQSYFYGFRKNLVQSPAFQAYWDELPMLTGYKDAVVNHEFRFTKAMGDKGFTWDTYVDTSSFKTVSANPILYYHRDLIQLFKCPIIKRRSFFQDYDDILINTTGQPAFELYEYLRQQSYFDCSMIWENLLRTCHLEDLAKNLHLDYILASDSSNPQAVARILQKKPLALIMHLFFVDLIDDMLAYVRSMPEAADIYISTNTAEKKQTIEAKFSSLECHKLEVRVTNNQGRDVSSLLVGMRDVIPQYEYICYIHDKKSGQVKPGSVGESFAFKCLGNTLFNRHYVNNILETFEQNPQLGLLVPPEPNHSYYFFSLGDEWSWNYDNTRILAQLLGLNVPISDQKRVFAPLGSYFWFRASALAQLFKAGLDYTDFPEEPLPEDGSISHALERIYPFVAQNAGYYTGVMMVDQLARMEYTNLRHYVSSYNKSAFEYSIRGLFTMMNATVNRRIYDAPKWVKIAADRYDHIMTLSADIEHLQALYQSTFDYKLRRLIQPLLPRSIFLRLKHKMTGGK